MTLFRRGLATFLAMLAVIAGVQAVSSSPAFAVCTNYQTSAINLYTEINYCGSRWYFEPWRYGGSDSGVPYCADTIGNADNRAVSYRYLQPIGPSATLFSGTGCNTASGFYLAVPVNTADTDLRNTTVGKIGGGTCVGCLAYTVSSIRFNWTPQAIAAWNAAHPDLKVQTN